MAGGLWVVEEREEKRGKGSGEGEDKRGRRELLEVERNSDGSSGEGLLEKKREGRWSG